MNKQQFYTFGGALLASTALTGAANAITFGRILSDTNMTFSSTPFSISNLLFSTTASTANTVTITPSRTRVGASFSNVYSVGTAPGTRFSVEISPTGGQFTSGTAALANAFFLSGISGAPTFVNTIAATICASAIGFGTQFVIDGCTANTTASNTNRSVHIGGLVFSGVTFTNASGLATAGNSISLTGRVYNTATGGNFEAQATNAVITSAAAVSAGITASANVTVSATTTPTAFTALQSSNIGTSTLTMDLIRVNVTANGALTADLSTLATPGNQLASARVTVTSAVLSGAGVHSVYVTSDGINHIGASSPLTQATVANFSGGTATFELTAAQMAGSFIVRVAFNGTGVIPQASNGTASVVFGAAAQATGSISGTTAATAQGGFRSEVNMFNSTAQGPFSSYLRIHNNGGVAGAVTITVHNDAHDSGAILGSAFTTAAIAANGTMQLSAADIEGTGTAGGKLPNGGANIPTTSRMGNYTLRVTGPIVGYVQHILFDGHTVADLSSFRNGGATAAGSVP